MSKRKLEAAIIYEVGPFWVLHEGPGLYLVLKTGLTHSTVVGTYHFRDEPTRAEARAVADAERRAAEARP